MRSGFTLMEIVVVLAIITVASAVTVPRLLDVTHDDLYWATQEVVRVVDDARGRAAQSGSRRMLVIDPASREYWIEDGEFRVLLTDTLRLPDTVNLERNSLRLTFDFMPAGSASADTIALTSTNGTRRVTADIWTGEVRAY